MEFSTPYTPLESRVEMFTKGRPQSIVPMTLGDRRMLRNSAVHSEKGRLESRGSRVPEQQRPVSEVTEILSTDDSESEFEEDSDELIDDEEEERRTSQTTVSTWEEVHTPISGRRSPLRIDVRKSVEGPKGPHLFRHSSASSEFSFDHALQLSPLHGSFARIDSKHGHGIDETLHSPAPSTTITETAYIVPSLGQSWQSEDPKLWSAQQVAVWMKDSGVEPDIIDCFIENDMTGAVLLDLQFRDLKELGIRSFGKRHKVWNHISRLKPADESADRPADAAQPRKRSTRRREKPADAPECSSPTALQMNRESARENAPSTEPQSIVAIEQLIPKPHKCHIGEDCPKAQHHRRIIRKLQKQHGFLMSPEDGDRLYLVASPISNPNRISALLSEEKSRLAAANPSSSTHDLEDGVFRLSLDAVSLRQIAERDPQENVKAFLALQQLDASQILPLSEDDGQEMVLELPSPGVAGARASLQSLPRLKIPHHLAAPASAPLYRDHSAATTLRPPADQPSAASKFSPRHTIAAAHHSLPRAGSPQQAAAEHGGYAVDAFAGPAFAGPAGPYATPPIPRASSQSVPPNMHFRPASPRVASSRRRPSLPPLPEGLEPAAAAATAGAATPRPSSAGTGLRTAHASHAGTVTGMPPPPPTDALYPNVTHSGWMHKREQKRLLVRRPAWHERHFRLTDDAQLTMHRNDMPAAQALDKLNIDDYAVNCSSIGMDRKAEGGQPLAKLAARLRGGAGRKTPAPVDAADGDATAGVEPTPRASAASALTAASSVGGAAGPADASFSFQLVPTRADGAEAGRLRRAVEGKKTHYFAVRTRDERIDWMRELMLVKAERDKAREGYDVQVHRGPKEDAA